MRSSDKSIVFLDIDGVLQPCWSVKRHDHDLDRNRIEVAENLGDSSYLKMDKYDIGAVCYDWESEAVENLRQLLVSCKAQIVLSTGWKWTRTIDEMKRLFRIYNLDQYIVDETPNEGNYNKKAEILSYLTCHTDVWNYVVIDDFNMSDSFPNRMIYTGDARYFTESKMEQAKKILNMDKYSTEL